jgi:hypothetical protein
LRSARWYHLMPPELVECRACDPTWCMLIGVHDPYSSCSSTPYPW